MSNQIDEYLAGGIQSQRRQHGAKPASPRTRVLPPSRGVDAYLNATKPAVKLPLPTIGMDSADAFRNLDGGVCLDDPTMCWAYDAMPVPILGAARYINGKS